jgi:hypothetical protein
LLRQQRIVWKIGGVLKQMSLASKLLRQAKKRRTNAQIELLSRPGCHLCEVAEIALAEQFGASNVQVIDIRDQPELEDLYVFRIPVVLYSGQPIAEGVIDRGGARRLRQTITRLQRADRSRP